MFYELDCVVKQRLSLKHFQYTVFDSDTADPSCVSAALLHPTQPPHFLEGLHDDTYETDLKHYKMDFGGFIPEASSHSAALGAGYSRAGRCGAPCSMPGALFWVNCLVLSGVSMTQPEGGKLELMV